ncbi:MAG: gliding motility-associated C-terminal domain-containing protein, partial [Flavobacteriales bacterium]|nr:gliding motility-associated C-terminal domain-containing protein [Flavobacteriales bacterium]
DAGQDTTICLLTDVQLGGNPTGPSGSSYSWAPSAGLDDAAAANPVALPAATTTYTVTVTGPNSCVDSSSVTVTVVPPPSVDAGSDTTICLGGSAQLMVIGNGSAEWSPIAGLDDPFSSSPLASPQQTTTYLVTVTDSIGCSASDEVTVSVVGLPTVQAGPDQWVCPGFDVPIEASGALSYSWSPITGLDDPTSPNPNASPASTTTYTVTGTDANGCQDSDQLTVTVNDDPPVDAGPDQSACSGDPVMLGGSPSSLPGSTFSWSPASGLDDPNSANPMASPGQTTLYTLTVTNDTCTSTDQVLVTLAGSAEAAFTLRMEPRCDGLRGYFNNLSTGATTYVWDFGNGEFSEEAEPSPYFDYGNDLVITLTATDAQGCSSTLTQTYPAGELSDHTDITVPNVFTPNGDGRNDLFTIITDASLGGCVDMFIFNRWGQKVFESIGNNITWDGRTFAGEQATVGTYFYTITLNGMKYEGALQLMR